MSSNNFKKVIVLGVVFIFIFTIIGFSLYNYHEINILKLNSTNNKGVTFGKNNLFGDFTHNVFVGVGTSQMCEPCHGWSKIIHESYISGLYNFDYVEMIEFDHDGKILNEKANEWSRNYDIGSYPTSIFDGDFTRIIGNYSGELNNALNSSGERDVADIDAFIELTWLGDAKIQVNISIVNNEETQYQGYIRAFITEIESRYDTFYGEPYHFGFLDYAYDKIVTIGSGNTYFESVIWDGNEHEDKHGDDFGDIIENNIQITLVVYNQDNGYVDESISATMTGNSPPIPPYDPSPQDEETEVDIDVQISWMGGDPDGDSVYYDVYFDEFNPPKKVINNQSSKSYNPGILEYSTDYFWKIVAWDEHGLKSEGEVWRFTTNNFEDLEVEISTPEENSFYLRNTKLFSIPQITFIYGALTIVAKATSSAGIEKVEFYIDNELKETDEDYPYEYKWSPLLSNKYTIKIIAYDNDQNQKEDEITILKWRAHPVLIILSILLILKLILK